MFRLAAPLLFTASALNDETSLMQGMKPSQQVSQPADKSKAIANLLSTATSMLKNGETQDVVVFAEATLQEISSAVLPAIQDAHDSDQALIDHTFEMFAVTLANLEADNAEIKALSDAEHHLSVAHGACRSEEEEICDDKRECDYDLYATWLRFVEEEYELRRLSKEVEDHFCLEGNGTMWIFRDHSVTLFPPWLTQKPIVEHWEYEYNRRVPVCETWYDTLNEKTAECDGIQGQLEEAACLHANRVEEARIRFFNDWGFAVHTYQRVVDEVHCLEIDRWKEWRTLETVQCLLTRTRQRNGRPCEEETDEITTEVAHCEQVMYDVNIDHLRIVYHEIPYFPHDCETPRWALTYTPDVCVPLPPPAPCSWQEYDGLWVPPQPIFHSTNSHCNQRAPCAECYVIQEPTICGVIWSVGHSTMWWMLYPTPEDECQSATRGQLDEHYWETINVGSGYIYAPQQLD